MHRHILSSMGLCVLLAHCSVVAAAPADLGLSTQAPDRIIRGATVPVFGYVYNVAAAGADDLNYAIHYTLPDGSITPDVNGTRAADGGASPNAYQYDFNSTGAAYGPNNFTVTVTGDPGTLHSPQAQQVTVQVLNHVVPAMWIQGVEVPIRQDVAQAPSVEPLAFGATGGGETFSAAAPHILGDPLVPTAAMDLDDVSEIGDPQITADLIATSNVAADDNPLAGIAWNLFLDGSVRGHYSKIFTLLFSDEDIPGAVSTGSISAQLRVDADVTDGGVTGTLTVLPEPATLWLLGVALTIPAGWRSRR